MNIHKVSIEGTEIPIQKGILGLVNVGDEVNVEVELEVHPTVVNYVDLLSYIDVGVTLLPKHGAEINGKFDIHTGQSSILLVGKLTEVEGIHSFSSIPYKKRSFPLQQGKGITLDNELKLKQKSMLIHILGSLLENDIQDKGNQLFVTALLEKLKEGKKLNSFDRFIKAEVSYLLEEAMNKEI